MSWSHSLIKSTLAEFADEVQEMTNLTTGVKFKALLDFHEEVLEDDDYYPFFIMGENLPVKLGEQLQIKKLIAETETWDYQDGTYQIINLKFKPDFALNETVTNEHDEQYQITEVTDHFYRVKSLNLDIVVEGILPLIYQDVLKKIPLI